MQYSVRYRTLVRLLPLLGACSAQTRTPAPGSTISCPAETRSTTTLRLVDGRTVYVEPMTSARSANSILLAGEPVYAWTSRDGTPELDTTHRLLGVRITSGRVEPFPKPNLPGVVTHVRLLADGADFAAVFAVTDSSSVGRYEAQVQSYWFGRTDGRSWMSLERLPLPPRAPDARQASRLVRSGADLLIAMPIGIGREKNVAVFSRVSRRWRVDTLAVEGTTDVSLTTSDEQPLLYVIHADTVPDGSNLLSVFKRSATGWHSGGTVLRGGSRSLYDPDLLSTGQDLVLSWADGGFGSGITRAHGARVRADGGLTSPVTLLREIDHFAPIKAVAGGSSWVISRPNGGSQLLTLVEWRDSASVIRDVVSSPFKGPVFALLYDNSKVAIGPVFKPESKEGALVSGILRFTPRCRLPVPRETP